MSDQRPRARRPAPPKVNSNEVLRRSVLLMSATVSTSSSEDRMLRMGE